MRRRVVVIVAGAVALWLAVTVAVLVGLVLPRLRPATLKPDPRPSYAPGELTPEESTVVVDLQADGTVRVDQLLTFDAGPGTDRPVTLYLGGTRLGHSDTVRYAVLPTIDTVRATVETPGAEREPLQVRAEEGAYADPFSDGRRYAVAAPGRWSPGRHRVGVSFVLRDVWVEVAGRRVVVLPLRFASGPDTGQPANLLRLTVNGAVRLDCPDSLESFAERTRCSDDERLVYRPAELASVEAVTVPDPGFVTAAPVPVAEQAR